MVAHEVPAQTPEKQKANLDIPKSREIFTGDINEAVIRVQQITGFEITPEWWMGEVGNEGPTEDILDRFDSAFEKLVQKETGLEIEEASENAETSVMAEAAQQLAEFDEKISETDGKQQLREEFLEALTTHLKEKYYRNDTVGSSESEPVSKFGLTDPEERTYPASEAYRFMVHVPLGDVARRANEIGHERGETKLMTSLISNEHQGTFLGEGGILVAEPSEESVFGISSIDVGGEIQTERKDTVEDIIEPAAPSEYNQIDIAFDGTRPVGVLIKQTPDGQPLGSTERNMALAAYAREHGLPIVTVEIEPAEIITGASVDALDLPDDQGEMMTVDLPYSDTAFFRSQVLRIGEENLVYHAGGASSVARTMKVNQYGESSQELSSNEERFVLEKLQKLLSETASKLVPEDIATIERELVALKKNS